MIEWALVCSRAGDLADVDVHLGLATTRAGRLGELQTEARDATIAAFGRPRFTRLYFGNEFCERLLPSAQQARQAYHVAASRQLGFSLLTPYATDAGLERLRPLIERLASLDDPRLEIVVNDWGVLHLLRREFPRLGLVAGRLTNRMLRDPRIAGALAGPGAPAAAAQALRQSAASVDVFRGFLGRMGVSRVEFDNVVQGVDMDFRALGLAASLYLPYGYVATGRVCAIGSLRLRRHEKFDVVSACHQECRAYTLRFEYADPLDPRSTRELFAQGNTHFYFHGRELIEASARMVQQTGIGRLVYQPALPM